MKLFGKICCMIPILLSVLGAVFVELFDVVFLVISTDSSFHFGLMTVNALFGGFLYSNYGMLVGLLDNDTIQKVKGTTIMARRNALVLAGIVYATLSVVCGLYITLVGIGASGTYEWLFCWMINGEVVFMIAAMVFYLLSLIEMNRLVKALYNTGERLGKRRISQMKKRIMNVGKQENEE